MKAKVLRNLKHDGKRYRAGEEFDGNEAVVKQLVSDGVLDKPTKAQEPAAPTKSPEPSTDWKLDELKAYAAEHGVENADSFRSKQEAVDAINAKAQEPAS